MAVAIGVGTTARAAGGYTTNTILFSAYTNRTALIAGGWNFWATNSLGLGRNTEITNVNDGAMLVYKPANNPSALRIPVDQGFLFTTQNDSRNSLFRALPTNWVSLRLRLDFHPYQSFQEANLMVYQDDDDFLWLGHTFSGNERVRYGREFTGLLLENTYEVTVLNNPATNMTLRLDRNADTDRVTALYSLDGTNWLTVGDFSQSFPNPRIGIYVGGSPGGLPDCDLLRLDVVTMDNPVTPAFVSQARRIVFNMTQGKANTNLQALLVGLRSEQSSPVNWTLTNSAPTWLATSITNGTTPTDFDVSLKAAATNLVPGTYTAVLGFRSAGVTSLDVPVTLVVNPDVAVQVATWQGARSGAVTVSVDDSKTSGYFQLYTNNFTGSFMLMQEYQSPVFTELYSNRMELGAHTLTHPCVAVSPAAIRGDLERNILGILRNTPIPQNQLISLAWPCGISTVPYHIVAADYFLCARGYNINQLESATPRDFLNLRSYNSHENEPYPPADFKTLVDAAEAQGKWFNLVLHNFTTDDNAITYSAGKNVWVSSLGSITKYIYQRDRTVITNYNGNSSQISFNTYRLPVEASSFRSFESAFSTNDFLTFKMGLAGITNISAVFVGGSQISFTTNAGALIFNAVVTTNSQTVIVDLTSNSPPVLPPQANRIVNELAGLVVTNLAADADLPPQPLVYTVAATNMSDGSSVSNLQISSQGIITWIPGEEVGPGSYYVTTIVSDMATPPLSATNGFMVTVNEMNQAPILPSQGIRTIIGSNTLIVTNAATDGDIPANTLSYVLLATNLASNLAVTNALIDSSGVISWTPNESQLGSTNLFTTIVTDFSPFAFNSQHLTATNSFMVVAHPYPLKMPAQTNRAINELTTMFVTNQAILVAPQLMGGWLSTNAISFNYTNRSAFVADGWSFLAQRPNGAPRNTEVTNPAVGLMAYAQTNATLGTVLRVPCDTGDLWMGLNNTTNTIFRELPTNWISARLRISFAASQNYMQTYLMLYQDDDNYLEVGRAYIGGEHIEFVHEVAGVPTTLAAPDVAGSIVTLRLDRNPVTQSISAYYSANNIDWFSLGSTTHSLTNARLGIWTGAAISPYANTGFFSDYSRLDIVSTNNVLALDYSLAVTNTADQTRVTNVTIDATGVISWVPTEAQGPGVYSFTTSVTDGSFFATNSFAVTVNEVNAVPSLQLPANTFIYALSNWTAQAGGTDVDLPTNTLTFELLSGPSGLNVSSFGLISWTPSAVQGNSTNTVTIRVVDNSPLAVNATSLSSTGSFTVVVSPVLTITALNASRSFTAENPGFSANFSGFVNGDGPGVLDGSLTFTTPATNGSPAGVYPIFVSGVSSSNYVILFVAGELTVTTDNATVLLQNLTHIYDGSAKSASATTVPAGLVVNLSYNGGSAAPTNAGSYEVVGVIQDVNYVGSATNTLVIAKSNVVVSLTGLSQTYNATPRIATAVTVPSGLNVNLSYDGNANPPVNVGSYQVIATVIETNYTGSATNTLTVVPLPSMVLAIAKENPGTVVLSWNSVSNLTYRVEYKDNLLDLDWSELSSGVTATGPFTSVTNSVGSQPQRFFRVQALP